MFARRSIGTDLRDLERIEAIVRSRFAVGDDQIVLVTEEDARLPGGPERVTTILFWTGRDRRHKVRVFKPAAEVSATDLPMSWLRGALLDEGEADCC